MEAGPSLRELFAALSRAPGADPAALLRAAGYGDVPGPLMTEAIVHYAGTAPVEVAEHLTPFAVAHGPMAVHDPAVDPADAPDGLSLLAAAPAGQDAPVDVEHVEHVEHVDLDPSGLDHPGLDHPGLDHPGLDHTDVDPATVDGLDHGAPHAHTAQASFGTGDGHPDDGHTDDAVPVHHDETFPAHAHVEDVDAYDHGVSEHDVVDHPNHPDHGDHPDHGVHDIHDIHDADPADLLDGDEHFPP